jgi:hypothetical protein
MRREFVTTKTITTATNTTGDAANAAAARPAKAEQQRPTLTFDLHPLYASILQDGAQVREGDVLGLDVDLRRVLVAPFGGSVRLLVTGQGAERRVKVFLTEARRPTLTTATGSRN